ncbi:hypothetical protein F4803DRAFT_532008 [Xylaria telfairii]|nr:hypothetical protein F4803DRAFT_532008 [Xylaria telfairii]
MMNQTALDEPALKPPAGTYSILDNPPNQNALVEGVSLLCLAVTTIAFLIHAYSRVFVFKSLRIEDFLIFASYSSYIVYIYLTFRIINGLGWFVHQWNVRVRDAAEFSYVIFIGANIYNVVIACGKAAIILEWIRLFVPVPTRNLAFYGFRVVLVVNTVYYAAATITQNLACTPYRYSWDKTIPGGHCIQLAEVYVASASIDIVTDIVIFMLPQQVIWQLQMSTKKRFGLSLIFAVGIFGILSAIFRVIVSLNFEKAEDGTYSVSTVALWALAEMTSVFIIACVPAVPRVFSSQAIPKAASRLASWVGLRTYQSSRKSPDSPWTPHGPRSNSNKYRKIYDSIGLPLTTLKGNSVCIDSAADPSSASPPASQEIRILRTIDILQEDESSDGPGHSVQNRQHPWLEEGQQVL